MTCKLAIALAFLATASCSNGPFDDAENSAQADSRDQPPATGDIRSDQFPIQLESFEVDPAVMRFAALGARPPSLSTFEYEPSGSLSAASIVLDELTIPPMGNQLDLNMAVADDGAAGVVGMIAVGGWGNQIALYEARTGGQGPGFIKNLETTACGVGMPSLPVGTSMSFADTNIGPGSIDLIVAQGAEVMIFVDIDGTDPLRTEECFKCVLAPGLRVNSVAAIDMTTIEADIEEVLITSENTNDEDMGRWDVIPGSRIMAAAMGGPNPLCASIDGASPPLPIAGADEPGKDFGKDIVISDFNNDDVEDVAFAVPSEEEVVVYNGFVFVGVDPIRIKIEAPLEGANFANTIAAGDIDNDDTPELLATAFRAVVDGEAEAGLVHVFNVTGDNASEGKRLGDSTPEAEQRFGSALTVGEFPEAGGSDENQDLAIVGATELIFTFFVVDGVNADPRR